MSKSNIEWTEQTWNPIVGCSILTPGCTNCYAMKMAARIQKMNLTGGSNSNYVNHYDGTTRSVNGNTVWTGKLAMAPDKLFLQPLSRKKPTTYFVNSMGDLFHEDCPDEWIDRVFAVMALAPQHTFQVLTKRAGRMREYFAKIAVEQKASGEDECFAPRRLDQLACDLSGSPCAAGFIEDVAWPLKNVWLGVSAERQQEADERIPLLLQTPAAIRFISAEPLLGLFDLIGTLARFQDDPIAKRQCAVPLGRQLIDWVIAGGESGPGARPMHPDWARSLRDQCAAAGIAFFFKQWGEWGPDDFSDRYVRGSWLSQDGTLLDDFLDVQKSNCQKPCLLIFRLGKKVAGRHLDGELHNAMPAVRT